MSNPELNPRPRHKSTGQFVTRPSSGPGHVERTSSEDAFGARSGRSFLTPVEKAARDAESLRVRRGKGERV